MSQSSTSSYTFTPIGPGNGENTATATTKIDKAVASVSRLQSNALTLKQATSVVDEVLESLDRFTWPGKTKDISKLKRLKYTLESVVDSIKADALILSPIASMRYVQQRRSVSPDTIDTSDNKRRVQSSW